MREEDTIPDVFIAALGDIAKDAGLGQRKPLHDVKR